jgi:hypothetical protein
MADGGLQEQLSVDSACTRRLHAQAGESTIPPADEPGKETLATFVGAVPLIVGATIVLTKLPDVLDRIWPAPARAGDGGIWTNATPGGASRYRRRSTRPTGKGSAHLD